MITWKVSDYFVSVDISLNTDDPNKNGTPEYRETVEELGESILRRLKEGIEDAGGMTGGVNPDFCNGFDLHSGLLGAAMALGFQMKSTGMEGAVLPPPPKGSVY